jgi:hypothetical protein
MVFLGALGPVFLRSIIKKSRGRAIRGEPATLTLVPKGKRLTVIAALTKVGFIHYRLVDSGDKKKGTNSKIPRNSVLILDNCRIHQATNLEAMWHMARTTFLEPHRVRLQCFEAGRIQHPFRKPWRTGGSGQGQNGNSSNRGGSRRILSKIFFWQTTPARDSRAAIDHIGPVILC